MKLVTCMALNLGVTAPKFCERRRSDSTWQLSLVVGANVEFARRASARRLCDAAALDVDVRKGARRPAGDAGGESCAGSKPPSPHDEGAKPVAQRVQCLLRGQDAS